MLRDSVWPLSRARDRLAAELYQRRHPGVPWLSRAAIELLPDLLRSTDTCLEWGSGSSTAWLGNRVSSIRSVEHDPIWFERVQAQMAASSLDPGAVRLLSAEPRSQPGDSPYVRAAEGFADGGLDVCLIDGEHRSACALSVLPKLASGGLLILDDAHELLDHPTVSPHSRVGRGPLNPDWGRFAALVRTWRLIWCSDGFSDAALWLKP